jgi:spore cortex formation protein SpoVR/YcgB (stage V sporulation)
MLECLDSHTAVVYQPAFDSPAYSGINPYALGYNMMRDIERICTAPTEEDRRWFPEFAGSGDHMAVLKDAWANYRDESFITQFLSPKVMRDMRLFSVLDDSDIEDKYLVMDIHDDEGYENLRKDLSSQYDISNRKLDIQVTGVDDANRTLFLTHYPKDEIALDGKSTERVLDLAESLWGYPVEMSTYP